MVSFIITDTCCQTVTKDSPIPARHSRLTTNWMTAFAAVFYADHSRDSWYDLDHSLFIVPIVLFIRKICQTKCIRFQTLIVFLLQYIHPNVSSSICENFWHIPRSPTVHTPGLTTSSMSGWPSSQKISSKSVHNFVGYLTQTDTQTSTLERERERERERETDGWTDGQTDR